jgi:RND family efflux transporter MFP subunit
MKIVRISVLLLLIFAAAAFASKNHSHGDGAEDHDHAAHGEAPSSITVTQWTDKMELFLEYPLLVTDTPGRFIIHLTILDGSQPVRDGKVSLIFMDSNNETIEIEEPALQREGIFTPEITLAEPDTYQLYLSYSGTQAYGTFHIENFIVYPDIESIHAHTDEPSPDEINFLKEQQWKIPFATAQVETREMKSAVWAIGEVLPNPKAYAEIVAPVDGIVQIAAGDNLALPGSAVQRGDVLATITPPLQGNSWVASRLAFEQAKRDFERAQRLKQRDAISEREYEKSRNEFEARKAGFERLTGAGEVDALILKAPISGKIIEWIARPGQMVRSGDKLMAVVDPSVVWLKVNVYENDFRALARPVGAYIDADAASGGLFLGDDDMSVLTTGASLDPVTRTIPVLLEVANTSGRLTINESTPVELYSSDGDSSIAVPRTAVYEDGGLKVVFVQTGGESFEKRIVTTGPRYAGWVSVIQGLQPGDRIVTQGAYHVKLASTSAEIGHGHTH